MTSDSVFAILMLVVIGLAAKFGIPKATKTNVQMPQKKRE